MEYTPHKQPRTPETDRLPSPYHLPQRTFETVSLEPIRFEAGRRLLLDRFGETRAGT